MAARLAAGSEERRELMTVRALRVKIRRPDMQNDELRALLVAANDDVDAAAVIYSEQKDAFPDSVASAQPVGQCAPAKPAVQVMPRAPQFQPHPVYGVPRARGPAVPGNDYLRQELANHVALLQRRQQLKRQQDQVAARVPAQRQRVAGTRPDKQHCVRCHKTFDPAINVHGACRVEHDPQGKWDEDGDPHGCGGACRMRWDHNSVHCSFRGHPDCPDYVKPCCFNGKHTTNPADVAYNGVTISTCASEGCDEDEDSDDDA